MLALVQCLKNWFRYKDLLVLDKYIIQTSEKRELNTKDIKIKNYIMSKRLHSFFDFRETYFTKYKARKNILVEELYNLFGDYLFEAAEYSIKDKAQVIIQDYSKNIYVYEVVKNLIRIQFDNKQILIYLSPKSDSVDKEELDRLIKDTTSKFMVIDIGLLETYSIDEIIVYFGLTHRARNPIRVIGKLVDLFTKEKMKLENADKVFNQLFVKNDRLAQLTALDFSKYIYINKDFKIPYNKLLNIASIGTIGGGKTIALDTILAQALISGNFRRIIFFDTQDSFRKKIAPNINPIYTQRYESIEGHSYFVDEEGFYLNEIDFVNSVNFILESYGYKKKESKQSLVNHEYTDADDLKSYLVEFIEVEKSKLSLAKELGKIEDLERLLKFVEIVQVKPNSIFDDLENQDRLFLALVFRNEVFYEVSAYLYVQKLKHLLYDSNTKLYTGLFADETQKYLKRDYIKHLLVELVKEKRQHGFRFFYTGLSYQDIKDFVKYTQHIIFNSLNDEYIVNNVLKSRGNFEDYGLNMPVEKIILNTNTNKVDKENLSLNLINYKNIK